MLVSYSDGLMNCLYRYLNMAGTVEHLLTDQGHIRKSFALRTKILVPTGVTNTFLTSERRKPLYYSKKWQ